MEIKQKFDEARNLIKAKQYQEARAILVTIDHDKAREWVEKIDTILFGQAQAGPPALTATPSAVAKPKRDEVVLASPPPPPVPVAMPAMPVAPAQPVVAQVQVNVNTTPSVMVVRDNSDQGPGCVMQVLWFVFIGSWLSQLAIVAGYFMIVAVILMPFGFMLLNRVPYLATLRSFKREMKVTNRDGFIEVTTGSRDQHPILLRLFYFLLIGWWFGFVILELAWFLTATYLLAPLGLGLFRFAPAALTLRR